MMRATGKAGGEPGRHPHVARFIGLALASEEQSQQALALVAERHRADFDIRLGATTLSVWSRENVDSLGPMIDRYGTVRSDQPRQLRAALFGARRPGAVGLLMDLKDLALLVEHSSLTWTMLFQGAKELHDMELLGIAGNARDHNRRQLAWLRTQIEHAAPETLAVKVGASS
jgi:hypothetical protein